MKALFAGIVIGGCSVVSALAADLAVKAPPYLPPAAEMNWSGLYAGVQGGYGWGNSNYSFPPVGGLTLWAPNVTPDAGGAFSQGLDGGVFGGHIGFNHQTSNWVVGLEGSFDWSGLKGTSSNVFPPALVPPGATYNSDLKWLATITPRLGYAANRWLFYVKGGLAAGQFNSSVTSTAVAPSIVVQEKNRQAGWTAGAGVEYAATNNWIVGLEYNYFDLGSERYGGNAYQAGVPTNFGDYNVAARFSTINARLSYKWDDRAAASISPMPTKAPTYTASTGNWTGFYAGIHGGYGWGNAPYAFSPHSPVAGGAWAPLSGGTFGDNIGGGLFGGHSGYNHQMGNWVLGLEGSFAWSGLKGSTLDLLPGGGVSPQSTQNWSGSRPSRRGSVMLRTTGSSMARAALRLDGSRAHLPARLTILC